MSFSIHDSELEMHKNETKNHTSNMNVMIDINENVTGIDYIQNHEALPILICGYKFQKYWII